MAAQAIAKLVAMAAEKESHLLRRARQAYTALRHFASPLVVAGGLDLLEHVADCTDHDPKRWAEDCPRCLAVHLGRRDTTPPLPFATPDGLKPAPRRRKGATVNNSTHNASC